MKVFAIGSLVKPLNEQERAQIFPKEVPATFQHYLDGKLIQFWGRQDAPGPIFLLEVESLEQAKATIGALPLTAGGYAKYDFIPVGPLTPLGLLLQPK